MGKRVTMDMIAEACRTSIGTVDRALNNREEINPETKRLILETAQRLGYRTNKFAGALSRKKILRFAFIYPTEPEGFYSCITMGIKKAGEELSAYGIEIDLLNLDALNPATQVNLLSTLNLDSYDGIAINSQNVACASQIDRLCNAGIPVVTFNNDLPQTGRLFYVGTHSTQSGRMGADVLATLMGGKGGVTVLGNFIHVMPFFERFDGFCQVIHESYPDITIYSSADCRLDTELTMQNIQKLLNQTPDLRGIFCAGYSSTIGAIRALKQLKRDDIILVGYDVSQETADAVKSGVCKALLYQDPYQQGYQAAHLLARHILEGWTPLQKQLMIETRVVFRQNIDSYTGGVVQWDLSI